MRKWLSSLLAMKLGDIETLETQLNPPPPGTFAAACDEFRQAVLELEVAILKAILGDKDAGN